MTSKDEMELDWWRKSFSCRFGPGNLPTPGTPLLGYRFRLMVDDPAQGYVAWSEH